MMEISKLFLHALPNSEVKAIKERVLGDLNARIIDACR